MKRTLALLICLLFAVPAAWAEAEDIERYRDEETGLCFFVQDGKTGLMTADGEILLEPCLSPSSYRFSEGLAAVCSDGAWGCIDTAGNWVIEPSLRLLEDFHGGYALAREQSEGGFGFVDASGSWAIAPSCFYIQSWSEGMYACQMTQDGPWIFLDEHLNPPFDREFQDALYFSEGLAPVKQDEKWGYIDASGQTVIDMQFRYAYPFSCGLASVGLIDEAMDWGAGNLALIDRSGTVVLQVPDATSYNPRSESSVIVGMPDERGIEQYVYYQRTESGFEAVPEVGSTFDMADYYPNEGERVAVLDEPATLNKRPSTEWRMPRVDGATALFPMYAALVQATYPSGTRYGDVSEDPDALITCTKTNRAYERLIDGEADILFVAGPSDAQTAAAAEKGVEFELTPLAKEAFVFIVNRENPLNGLSTQQIRDVYSGRTTQWSELGVDSLGEIIAYQRPDGSGSQTALERLMEGDELMEAPTDYVAWDMGAILDRVEYRNFPNAIGYSFLFYVTGLIQADVKLLAIDGVSPSQENIASGRYPLTTQIYAVTRKGDENPNTAAFLEWVQSAQAATLIQASGYVPDLR